MPGPTVEGLSALHHCGDWEEPASVLSSSPWGLAQPGLSCHQQGEAGGPGMPLSRGLGGFHMASWGVSSEITGCLESLL